MTKSDAPEKPEPAVPQLVAIRFPEPLHLHDMTQVEIVRCEGRDARQVMVQGGSVFILDKTTLAEVPRAKCVIRWRVPEGMTIGDAVAKIAKGGR